MRTACWAWAVVACAGALAVGADPVPPAKRGAENWLPVPRPRDPKDRDEPIAAAPPSAFPDLLLPERNEKQTLQEFREKRDAAFEKLCPRLTGKLVLKIESTDTVPQKLLKSRLHQAVLGYRNHIESENRQWTGPTPPFGPPFECLKDAQATALELWTGQPKELVPWLEELVVVAKEQERFNRLLVEAGAIRPSTLNYVTRHRLKAEAELWKAKNVNARREDPPAKKDDPKAKPVEGDWLADKKLPPSLFPDITPPPFVRRDPNYGWSVLIDITRAAHYAQLCPRLSGKTGLKIENGDTTLQKLLKARLHQGAIEIQQYRSAEMVVGTSPWSLSERYDCTSDVLATAVELFDKQPKELAPWLEELLIDAKEVERSTALLVGAGARRLSALNAATRSRLKVEAELWKAKNAK